MSEIGMVTGTNSGQSPYAWYNLMNQGAGNFMQQYGGVANNNWWTQMSDWFKGTNVGAGINSMGKSMGGWGNALGGLNALMSMYSGWKSMGLQEDYFNMAKNQFNKNYDAQRKMYENQLRDRWLVEQTAANQHGKANVYGPSEDAFLKQRAIGA